MHGLISQPVKLQPHKGVELSMRTDVMVRFEQGDLDIK
jgi:hypothetical protein